ncbi:MAG: PIG-L family deacetylase [Chromatiales bacterium]|nr:PIG-L family deacetylase [Chromatiales bacterium]
MYEETTFIPCERGQLPPGPWLVFAPHPDDETFGLGGTLLLAREAGIAAHVVVVTDGAAGGSGTDLVERREAETRAVGEALGLASLTFWRQPDRGGPLPAALMDELHRLLRGFRSSTHPTSQAPASVFFPSPFEPNPDHRACAAFVWDGLVSYGYRGQAFSYEISVQGPVDRLIDITAVAARKRELMAMYLSQLDQNAYVERLDALNRSRSWSLPMDATHAEGLCRWPDLRGRLADRLRERLSRYWQPDALPGTVPQAWWQRLFGGSG